MLDLFRRKILRSDIFEQPSYSTVILIRVSDAFNSDGRRAKRDQEAIDPVGSQLPHFQQSVSLTLTQLSFSTAVNLPRFHRNFLPETYNNYAL